MAMIVLLTHIGTNSWLVKVTEKIGWWNSNWFLTDKSVKINDKLNIQEKIIQLTILKVFINKDKIFFFNFQETIKYKK